MKQIIATGALLILWLSTSADGIEPLNELISKIDPETKKWASVAVVQGKGGSTNFDWYHYRDSQDAVDFWPASTIKLYTVIATLEYLNELGFSEESTLMFERGLGNNHWYLDSARTVPEMISEVFRRSSNEDYTLLLRFLGIDRINTKFLIAEKGFPHSALMRDYVTYRPVVYVNEEPQRITIRSQRGKHEQIVEHTWSGVSYSEQRGATVLSSTTGNCTSTYELVECLRRVMFHELIPESERFNLTPPQLRLVRFGTKGSIGLENKEAGDYAWSKAAAKVFPKARYFHKGGMISNYTLDVAYVDDEASGCRFLLCVAANSGQPGTVESMALAISQWVWLGQETSSQTQTREGTPLPESLTR
jgi:hypothetical protein